MIKKIIDKIKTTRARLPIKIGDRLLKIRHNQERQIVERLSDLELRRGNILYYSQEQCFNIPKLLEKSHALYLEKLSNQNK
ncbi:MAG: hypothetical protein WAV16_02040 [Candidatus Moraniibacteriota bacterium]